MGPEVGVRTSVLGQAMAGTAGGGKGCREPLLGVGSSAWEEGRAPSLCWGSAVVSPTHSSLCSSLLHLALHRINLACLNRARQRDESFNNPVRAVK